AIRSNVANGGRPQPPTDREQYDDNHIANSMPGADRLGACIGRNSPPVSHAEDCCKQPAQDTRTDHPERYRGEFGVAGCFVADIEAQRCSQKTQRKYDQHWMDRVPRQFNVPCHTSSSLPASSGHWYYQQLFCRESLRCWPVADLTKSVVGRTAPA